MLIVYAMIVDAALNKASLNFTGSKLLPHKRREKLEHLELVYLVTSFGTFASPIRFGPEEGLLRQKNNNKESQ